jgi:hypothetical protein
MPPNPADLRPQAPSVTLVQQTAGHSDESPLGGSAAPVSTTPLGREVTRLITEADSAHARRAAHEAAERIRDEAAGGG